MDRDVVRPIILKALLVCLAVATFPWLTGGKEPSAGLLSGAALLLAALLVWREGMMRRSMPVWVTGLYLGLMVWAAVSGLWTANRFSTILWLQAWATAGGVFWLSRIIGRQPGGWQAVRNLYMASAVVFALWGMGLYVWGDYDRLVGPIYWPNPAATYILPALILAFGTWLKPNIRLKKMVVNGVILVILGAAFWLTASRAALVILALYSVVLVVVQSTTKRLWIQLLFAIIIPWLSSLAAVQVAALVGHHRADGAGLSERVAEATEGQSQSLKDRWAYTKAALNMWSAQPIGGVGAGNFGDVHPAYQNNPVQAARNAHNLPAQMLAELGLVGLGLLGWLLLSWFAMAFAGSWQQGRDGVVLLLGVLAALTHMAVDIGASYPAILASVAMLMALATWQPARARMGRPAWVIGGFLLLAGGAIGIYQGATAAQNGQIYLENGEFTDASIAYDKANSFGVGNPDWLSARGIVKLAQSQSATDDAVKQQFLSEALDDALLAQARDRSDGQHWQLESRVRLALNQPETALAAALEALKRDPNNHPEYAGDAAAAYWRLGRFEAGIAVIDDMLARYPPAVRENRAVDLTLAPRLEQLEAVKASLLAADANTKF